MTIIIKKDGKLRIEIGIDHIATKETLNKVLQKKPHICASCASVACGENRSLKNAIVKSGVSTVDRDYIYECDGYIEGRQITPLKDDEKQKINSDERTYKIIHPTVREAINRM